MLVSLALHAVEELVVFFLEALIALPGRNTLIFALVFRWPLLTLASALDVLVLALVQVAVL